MSLSFSASRSQSIHLAEEFPLIRGLDVLNGELSSLLVQSHIDTTTVISLVVYHLIPAIAVEDPHPRAATVSLQRGGHEVSARATVH